VAKRESYRFNVTWVHLAGEDPSFRYHEYGILAVSVQRAIAKVLGNLNEAGYDRKDILILDVQNMDIT